MRFLSLVRFPENTADQQDLPVSPTQFIKQVIEREDGKLLSIDGTTAGWDCCLRYDCQSPEAQLQITMALKRVGFKTETRVCTDPAALDTAWQNAIKHPVTAGR